jgi:hypothetical protein
MRPKLITFLLRSSHDSTLTKLLHHDTIADMWASLVTEFTVKSSHVVATMHSSFDNLKCADNGNLRTQLNKLWFKYEELVGIGVTIPTDQYATRIIGSLPSYYQRHLSTVDAAACASGLAQAAAQTAALATAQATAAASTSTASTTAQPTSTPSYKLSPELLRASLDVRTRHSCSELQTFAEVASVATTGGV